MKRYRTRTIQGVLGSHGPCELLSSRSSKSETGNKREIRTRLQLGTVSNIHSLITNRLSTRNFRKTRVTRCSRRFFLSRLDGELEGLRRLVGRADRGCTCLAVFSHTKEPYNSHPPPLASRAGEEENVKPSEVHMFSARAARLARASGANVRLSALGFEAVRRWKSAPATCILTASVLIFRRPGRDPIAARASPLERKAASTTVSFNSDMSHTPRRATQDPRLGANKRRPSPSQPRGVQSSLGGVRGGCLTASPPGGSSLTGQTSHPSFSGARKVLE